MSELPQRETQKDTQSYRKIWKNSPQITSRGKKRWKNITKQSEREQYALALITRISTVCQDISEKLSVPDVLQFADIHINVLFFHVCLLRCLLSLGAVIIPVLIVMLWCLKPWCQVVRIRLEMKPRTHNYVSLKTCQPLLTRYEIRH